MENLSKILFLILFLSSCSLTSYYVDPIYEDHPHTTEVYWYTDYEIGGTPYFGYWGNFYYYYGVAHFYPWWYYYQFIPPHYYYTHSHIIIDCKPGHYVYGHRGSKFHNIGPDCPTNNGRFTPTIKVNNNKDKSFVFPRNWKSSNSTKINKTTNTNYNRIFDQSINTNTKPNKPNKPNNRPNKPNRPNKKSRK